MFVIIITLLTLGLPLVGMTWWLFHRLYSKGAIDRELPLSQVKKSLKEMKDSHKKEPKTKRKLWRANSDQFDSGEYVQSNWMKFGGGFYGLTALWTFFFIEATDVIRLLFNWSAIADIFSDGIISALFAFLSNQLSNFVQAFVWFNYWPLGIEGSVLIRVAVAYGAYLLGMYLAREGITPDSKVWQPYTVPAQSQISKLQRKLKQLFSDPSADKNASLPSNSKSESDTNTDGNSNSKSNSKNTLD